MHPRRLLEFLDDLDKRLAAVEAKLAGPVEEKPVEEKPKPKPRARKKK